VWHYDDGIPLRIGWGHSGIINCVTISPDERHIVSAGEDGGLFIWRK
jgi:WD40 repeat protein